MTERPKTTRFPEDVIYLSTLQLHWGGLFDGRPHDQLVHLVRGTRRGTPGALLCGIERFGKGTPGFSVGGGMSGPGIDQTPCPGCVEVAKRDFPGRPIAGMRAASEPIAAAVGVPAYSHVSDVPEMKERR